MQPLLHRLMQNKHTSIAGVIYVLCEILAKIGAIWLPEHQVQFTQSLEVVQKAALGYGLIMARDSGKPPMPPPDEKPPLEVTKTVGLIVIGFLLLLPLLKHLI